MRKQDIFSAKEFLLPGMTPEESAFSGITRAQKGWCFAATGIFVYLLWHYPLNTILMVNLFITLFYLSFTVYKVILIWPVSSERANSVGKKQLLLPEKLPIYTILVPLYREENLVRDITSALNNLDYPIECLDIKLLLEEDDYQTVEEVKKINPGSAYQVIILPPKGPRTKPKACNEGLKQAKGKYLVIYDAEDRPEPDQLKKAVAAFSLAPATVGCLQAKLNFYNSRQNLLTAWFSSEYSLWFDLYLPGLANFSAPVPLGGTSNHFRIQALREVGGWDPYNVAEDCDLGYRLYRHGWHTRILDSTTWEEASSHLSDWWRQRSRWVKGYLQTYLVHLRQPVKLLRELGFINTCHFHFTVGGLLFCLLINPVYWFLTFFWIVTRSQLLSYFFPRPVFLLSAFCLFIGNFIFVYSCALAVFRRHDNHLVKQALLIPPYWLLMSLASWKGYWQFFFRPHHWEKTRHGFFNREAVQ